jgi:predicted Zn-dependent protease
VAFLNPRIGSRSDRDAFGGHTKACYNPQVAQRVFARMKEGTPKGQQLPEFLLMHPSHDSRIKQMGDWLPETRRLWQQLDGGERCEQIWQEMAMARCIAAQRQKRVAA